MSRKRGADTSSGTPGARRARLLLALLLAGAAPAPVAASETSPTAPSRFAALVGNWVRPDGGYVLSVGSVAADGTAQLSYLNPRPIRVGRAEARRRVLRSETTRPPHRRRPRGKSHPRATESHHARA